MGAGSPSESTCRAVSSLMTGKFDAQKSRRHGFYESFMDRLFRLYAAPDSMVRQVRGCWSGKTATSYRREVEN